MLNVGIQFKSITFDDDSGRINYYRVLEFDGFSPDFAHIVEGKSAMHGADDYGYYYRARPIDIKGKIIASNLSSLESLARTLTNNFLPSDGYDWLKWQVAGEVAKQIYARPKSPPRYKEVAGFGFTREFWISLIAADPRIYSQTEYTQTVFIPSVAGGFESPIASPLSSGVAQTGGWINCNNNGNFESLPLVRMYGPLQNPYIRNNHDSAKQIKINMEVVDGDFLEINFENKTIMLNGSASRYNYMDSASLWWWLKPGNNEIIFRDNGGDTSAYAQIIYRHAWI